jgi:hypothetical protein
MKIRPALKGRNKILDHKPVLPLQGVAVLNTRSDSQGGALGWHVAAPSGRDSRSATSKFARGGKGRNEIGMKAQLVQDQLFITPPSDCPDLLAIIKSRLVASAQVRC